MSLSTRLNTRILMFGLIVLCGFAVFGSSSADAGELLVNNNQSRCVDVYLDGSFAGTVPEHSFKRLHLHVHGENCGDITIRNHSGLVLWNRHVSGDHFHLLSCINQLIRHDDKVSKH